MNYEKKERWKQFYADVFDGFARIFRYGISLVIIVAVQFIVIEGLIYLSMSRAPKIEILVYTALRLSLLFSVAFHGCSHAACRSYMRRKDEQHDGLSRPKKRAIRNFFPGIILFLVSLIVLLYLCFFEKA